MDGFDQDQVRQLLLELDGNVTRAAHVLLVEPERLRSYVEGVPLLRRAIDETMAQVVDLAVDVLFTALRDEGSFQNRYYAAKEILRSDAGRRRGFGPRKLPAAELKANAVNGGAFTLRWLEPPEEIAVNLEPAHVAKTASKESDDVDPL